MFTAEQLRNYYAANPEKRRAKDRKYYAAHPEKYRAACRRRSQRYRAAHPEIAQKYNRKKDPTIEVNDLLRAIRTKLTERGIR